MYLSHSLFHFTFQILRLSFIGYGRSSAYVLLQQELPVLLLFTVAEW